MYFSEENKNFHLKRCMHPKVHRSIIYSCQDMKATQVPINRGMDEEDVMYICTEILGIKKNEIMPFEIT